MLKNGMFIMSLGFIALILGLTGPGENSGWILALAVVCIVVGFILYYRAEKKEKTDQD